MFGGLRLLPVLCALSQSHCKAAMTFFHCCVLCTLSQVQVEALCLQTLLLLTFDQTEKIVWIYAMTSAPSPSVLT